MQNWYPLGQVKKNNINVSSNWINWNSLEQSLTFSAANRMGAVASPSERSAPAGLPRISDVEMKSRASSTS